MTAPDVMTDLLPRVAPIDSAAADPAARMAWDDVPAKCAVYLLGDANGMPMLLATVGDLRAALKRRLADTPPDQKSKRVQYGQLCTHVRFRIVHSPFAANWVYYQAARLLFPDRYRELISWRPTHFLAINPTETHPRFRRTESLDDPAQTYLGPIAERRAADKLIETLEDLFDLCRYHHILVQAPHGKACAYKEMGKCPAPCDGSITLDAYRTQIAAALAYLTSPSDASHARVGYARWRESQETAMRSAAAKLEFERAARLKAILVRGSFIESEPFARLDTLSRCSYLALQPGQGKPYVEPFFIHAGDIAAGEPVKRKDLPAAAILWYARCQALARTPVHLPRSEEQTEQLSLLAHHLFRGPDDAGIYLPTAYVTGPEAILAAANELLDRKKPAKPMAEQSSDRNAEVPEAPGSGDSTDHPLDESTNVRPA